LINLLSWFFLVLSLAQWLGFTIIGSEGNVLWNLWQTSRNHVFLIGILKWHRLITLETFKLDHHPWWFRTICNYCLKFNHVVMCPHLVLHHVCLAISFLVLKTFWLPSQNTQVFVWTKYSCKSFLALSSKEGALSGSSATTTFH
jgi:hypothetical protein